ncbi:glycosyltransferase family 2 protein [Methylobacterium currus]|uniref:Glycosyltransferase family 2 protein n=1 Tax=Methylobacterium currus TaxID=2051553 RepID=A0A2R4WU86_9HYPH|nr:glycosyltransferase family A protein [Methylobacterium currus]AWB25075.1 glycosyltransferase family 2 protein [Methylobacterium currus]UHC18901.1 glycosyltransferase family 2 protein [Methylobacterium currus]
MPAPRCIVAVPVRNEVDRIGACLRALATQEEIGPEALGIVLFLNNCTDGTAEVVASLVPALRVQVRVVERDFAGAHAGWARREAMEAAASWLDETVGGLDGSAPDGVILTTDADSRVPPDWVARNLAALAQGVDAVAGTIALDEGEAARLPEALHARGRLEGAYEALLVALESLIDPVAHDPWPRHATRSGASLAVHLSAYRAAGGMPALPLGEDRAFVAALLRADARVRHAPDIVVVTSGRLDGRAPGGAADTMRQRCAMPEAPCDPRLETLGRALFRYAWGRRLRRLHGSGRLARTGFWAPWLRVPRAEARRIADLASIGAILAAIEAASPLLASRPLPPRALPRQIRAARLVLAGLRRGARGLRLRGPLAAGRARPALGRASEEAGNA